MRVLCVGDSLGLPREGCTYEETWYYRLKIKYPNVEFVDVFTRALLITEAVSNYYGSYYKFYNADVVIVQTGICDCSPRLFNSNSRKGRLMLRVVKSLGLTTLFWKCVKRRDRDSNRVYTNPDIFFSCYNKLISLFVNDGIKKVILIKIGHATPSVLKKSKFFNHNVDKYNNLIDKIARNYPGKIEIVNPLDNVTESMFVDGYHCNKNGMEIVYNDLVKILESFFKETSNLK